MQKKIKKKKKPGELDEAKKESPGGKNPLGKGTEEGGVQTRGLKILFDQVLLAILFLVSN